MMSLLISYSSFIAIFSDPSINLHGAFSSVNGKSWRCDPPCWIWWIFLWINKSLLLAKPHLQCLHVIYKRKYVKYKWYYLEINIIRLCACCGVEIHHCEWKTAWIWMCGFRDQNIIYCNIKYEIKKKTQLTLIPHIFTDFSNCLSLSRTFISNSLLFKRPHSFNFWGHSNPKIVSSSSSSISMKRASVLKRLYIVGGDLTH